MSKKTFQSLKIPKSPEQTDIESFVAGGPGRDQKSGDTQAQKSVKTEGVRLTVDIPKDLHRRYKASCSLRGVKMNEEIREFIESEIIKS